MRHDAAERPAEQSIWPVRPHMANRGEALVDDLVQRLRQALIALQAACLNAVDRLLWRRHAQQVRIAPAQSGARVQTEQRRLGARAPDRKYKVERRATVGHEADPRGEVADDGAFEDDVDGQLASEP